MSPCAVHHPVFARLWSLMSRHEPADIRRGDVMPSGFLPLAAGNVRTRNPVEIYRRSPLFRQLRDPDALKGKCGRCEFRAICGGSRARAYALTGDPLASDPSCPYKPASSDAGVSRA